MPKEADANAAIPLPPPAGTPPPAVLHTPPHWRLVALLCFLLGLLLGGGAVYFALVGFTPNGGRFDGSAAAESGRATRPTAAADEAPHEAADLASPPDAASERRLALREREPETNADALPPSGADDDVPFADTTPAGLRRRFAPAVLTLVPIDPDGDRLPAAPAVAVGASLVLVPFSAIEGAASARVLGADRASWPVGGLVEHDAAHDLALLDVAGDLPAHVASVRGAFVNEPLEGTLLGPAEDGDWFEAVLTVTPGTPDPLTGGPRVRLSRPPPHRGALLDEGGALLALVASQDGAALAVHPAARWLDSPRAAIPLAQFRSNAGPGSPASRIHAAEKLLAQRRFREATLAFLDIVAEQPALLEQVRTSLLTAAEEAARDAITAGNGYEAVDLLSQVLARLPDEAQLLAARGRAFALTGNVTAALRDLLAAAELERDASGRAAGFREEARGILLAAATDLATRGRRAEAVTLLLNEMRAFPADGKVRMQAGDLLLLERRFEQAAATFAEAAAVDASVAAEARARGERARDLSAGPGRIAIDYAPGSPVVVSARVDSAVDARLVIDDTQRYVVLPAAIVEAAGYRLAATPRIHLEGRDALPGAPEVHSMRLSTLSVNGVQQRDVQAVVVDGAAPGADGILGASFLSRFRVVDDPALGRMVLHPK